MPRKMLSVPSVATMAGTRRTVTMNPLTMPSTRPRPTPTTIAVGASSCLPSRVIATTYATRPITASTDRSMLRVMTTSAWPTAATAAIDASDATFEMLLADRNWGAATDDTRANTIMIRTRLASRWRSSCAIERVRDEGATAATLASAIGRRLLRSRDRPGRSPRT